MVNIKEVVKIIKKPYNREILLLAKEGLSIFDISKKIDLSYTSTFFRIKELEKYGIIEVGKEEGQGNSSKIKISEKYDNIVQDELNLFISNEKEFKKLDSYLINIFKDFLIELKNKRLMSLEDVSSENEDDAIWLYDHIHFLEELGFIRTRIDITKKGINFIRKKTSK